MPPRTKLIHVAIATAFSLGGCVNVQQQAVTPTAPAPRPMMVVPMAAHPPQIIQKTAASGVPIMLDSSSSVDAGCHSEGEPTTRVSQPPAPGIVKLLQREVYPHFPPNNPRSACNNTKVPRVVAEYTSTAGFIGSDFTAVDVIFPDGKEAEAKFTITVK